MQNYHVFPILIGGGDAGNKCNLISKNIKAPHLNLCGKTNFMESAEIISRSKLLISCDSGPIHLAVAVGTPVVGIYTARDYPNCWFPGSVNSRALRHDVNCQVCLKTDCSDMKCINGISVDEVYCACDSLLGRKSDN